MKALRKLAIDQGGLLVLAIALYYGFGACPYIVENDTTEFATLSVAGGIAHPSGFPLYVLWLRAWSWLPAESPAHAAALATAILGVLQILVLHAACRAWGARAIAATFAVGIYAVAPMVTRYHTSAEAFAMNGLIVAIVLWLAAMRGPVRGMWRAGLLGLVAGLGLANHLTCALVAPIGILGLVRATREAGALRTVPIAIVGLLVGLSAYLYLFIAPDHLASWNRPQTLAELSAIVFREDYGGAFSFSGSEQARPILGNLRELAATVGRSWLWVLAPCGLVILGRGVVRGDRESRAAWLTLALSLLLSGPLLVLKFDLPLDPFGLWIARRFHLLPTMLLVIPVAFALQVASDRVANRVSLAKQYVVIVTAIVLAALSSASYVRRFRSPAVENAVRNTLASLPQDAILIGGADELDIGTRYLQLACGVRTDVRYIRWQAMRWSWYAAKQTPFRYDSSKSHPLRQVVEQALALGRPVFVRARVDTRELVGFGRYPHGVVDRILPSNEPIPSLDAVVLLNRELFAKYRLDYSFPGRDDDWETWMHLNYEQVWKRLANSLARAGNAEGAAAAREVAQQLAPR